MNKATEQDYKDRGLSRSYPFLSIAKKYGMDYGDVLIFADDKVSGDRVHGYVWTTIGYFFKTANETKQFVGDILFVVEDFKRIQVEGW